MSGDQPILPRFINFEARRPKTKCKPKCCILQFLYYLCNYHVLINCIYRSDIRMVQKSLSRITRKRKSLSKRFKSRRVPLISFGRKGRPQSYSYVSTHVISSTRTTAQAQLDNEMETESKIQAFYLIPQATGKKRKQKKESSLYH